MSTKKKKKEKNPAPNLSPEEQKKHDEEAAAKAKEALERDQKWATQLTTSQQDELFRAVSATCKETTMKDGKITLACPLPAKLVYCASNDPFECPNGRIGQYGGCLLSPDVSKALKDAGTCIDGAFVSKEEGGSYLSPYVPWGPVKGVVKKTGKPALTPGNNSGVTVGTGVDLGSLNESYLSALEKEGVSKETRNALRPFLGKKRAEACQALREAKSHGPIIFPQKDIELIDAYAMKSRAPALKSNFNKSMRDRKEAFKSMIRDEKDKPDQAKIQKLQSQIDKEKKKKAPDQSKIQAWKSQIVTEEKKIPDQAKIKDYQAKIDNLKEFENLKCSDQTILMSTYYHEGGLGSKHSKAYVGALIEGDSDGAKKALVDKTRDSNKLIADRGRQELQLFNSASNSSQGGPAHP